MVIEPCPKVLRVGIVEAGSVVYERILPPREPLSLGAGPAHTAVVQALGDDGVVLLRWREGRYWLGVSASMSGKLKTPRGVVSLPALCTEPEAVREGGRWWVPVDEQDCGKVVLGGITVLFQFVSVPAVSAVPPLEAMDFRPHLLEDGDGTFLGGLGLFTALAAAMAVLMVNTVLPETTPIEELPPHFARLFLPSPQATPPPERPAEVAAPVPVPAAPAPTPAKEPRVEEPTEIAEVRRREALTDDVVRRSALLSSLTSRGRGALKGVGGLQTVHDSELDRALGGATGGTSVASVDDGPRKGVGGVTGDAVLDQSGGIGGGHASLTDVPQAKVRPTVAPKDDDSLVQTTDAEAVSRIVRENFGQLTQCYERVLRTEPQLGGRVEMSWYVIDGAVSDVEVYANTTGSDKLGLCIRQKIALWHFPRSVSGDILYPFVFRQGSGG